jgi:hypothetical protein
VAERSPCYVPRLHTPQGTIAAERGRLFSLQRAGPWSDVSARQRKRGRFKVQIACYELYLNLTNIQRRKIQPSSALLFQLGAKHQAEMFLQG